jgi:hypothetical protein
MQALLRDAREQYTSWHASQPQHGAGGHQHRHHRHGQHSGVRHTSNPERPGLTEPRPYYFRLQRNLAARSAQLRPSSSVAAYHAANCCLHCVCFYGESAGSAAGSALPCMSM